jgi:hypothetical protein
MDNLVSTFVERTVDGFALVGIVSGGIAKQGVRGGVYHFFRPFIHVAPPISTFVHGGALAAGLIAEGSVFHAVPQGLRVLTRNGELSLLNIYGVTGLGEGALHSITGLAGIKMAGVATASFHPLVQNFAQASAMVGSNHTAALFGIGDKPRGEITQQLAEAESVVLHMWVGMKVVHQSLPGIPQREQVRNLAIQIPPTPLFKKGARLLDPELVTEGPSTMGAVSIQSIQTGSMASVMIGETTGTTSFPSKQITPEMRKFLNKVLPITLGNHVNDINDIVVVAKPNLDHSDRRAVITAVEKLLEKPEAPQDPGIRKKILSSLAELKKHLPHRLNVRQVSSLVEIAALWTEGKFQYPPTQRKGGTLLLPAHPDELEWLQSCAKNQLIKIEKNLEAIPDLLKTAIESKEASELADVEGLLKELSPHDPIDSSLEEWNFLKLLQAMRKASIGGWDEVSTARIERVIAKYDELQKEIAAARKKLKPPSPPVQPKMLVEKAVMAKPSVPPSVPEITPTVESGPSTALAESKPARSLSPLAKQGLRHLSLSDQKKVIDLLPSRPEIEEILNYVALLHEEGVAGYKKIFLLNEGDHPSLLAKLHWGLRFSKQNVVRDVELFPQVSIDGKRAILDLTVAHRGPDGSWKRHIVDVKSSEKIYSPSPTEEAEILSRARQYSSLAKRFDEDGVPAFEGVEYVFDASSVAADFLGKLKNVLEANGVPYLIRIVDGAREEIYGELPMMGEGQEIQRRPFQTPPPVSKSSPQIVIPPIQPISSTDKPLTALEPAAVHTSPSPTVYLVDTNPLVAKSVSRSEKLSPLEQKVLKVLREAGRELQGSKLIRLVQRKFLKENIPDDRVYVTIRGLQARGILEVREVQNSISSFPSLKFYRLKGASISESVIRGVLRRHRHVDALLHVDHDQLQGLNLKADRFGQVMRKILRGERFNGDIDAMARRAGITLEDCEAYLKGALPSNFNEVLQLAKRLGLGVYYGVLTESWLSDQIEIFNAFYPLVGENIGPSQQKLTELFRLAVLRRSKDGSLVSITSEEKGRFKNYNLLYPPFKGEFPIQPEPLREVFDFIVNSGVADESETRSVIAAYVEEQAAKRPAINYPPFDEYGPREFDPAYLDPLSMGSIESLIGLPPSTLLRANELGGIHYHPVSPFDQLASQELETLETNVSNALGTLRPKEEKVIKARFGIGGEKEKTLDQLGQEYTLTRERIRQIESKGLEKLRHFTRAQHLRPFVED